MAKRDVLNYLGQKIGELDLPNNTTEEEWARRLAEYAKPPKSLQELMLEVVDKSIEERKSYAQKMLDRFKRRNLMLPTRITVAQSLWLHHKLRQLEITFTHAIYTGGQPIAMSLDIMNMVVSGDIETACIALLYMNPDQLDDMSKPYHFFDLTVRDWLINDMKQFLGWA